MSKWVLIFIFFAGCTPVFAGTPPITTKIRGNFIESLADFNQKLGIALMFSEDYKGTLSDLKFNLVNPDFERTLILENLSALRARIGSAEYQSLMTALIESAGINSNFKLVIK